MGIPKQRIDRLEQVRSLIEENPSQSRSIEELTRIACMNRTTLRDLFKRVYGTTISDYRTELLMRRAMSMIIEDDLPISEITFLLGYSDAANLSVAFKRFHGAPPGAFRRKAEAYN